MQPLHTDSVNCYDGSNMTSQLDSLSKLSDITSHLGSIKNIDASDWNEVDLGKVLLLVIHTHPMRRSRK